MNELRGRVMFTSSTCVCQETEQMESFFAALYVQEAYLHCLQIRLSRPN